MPAALRVRAGLPDPGRRAKATSSSGRDACGVRGVHDRAAGGAGARPAAARVRGARDGAPGGVGRSRIPGPAEPRPLRGQRGPAAAPLLRARAASPTEAIVFEVSRSCSPWTRGDGAPPVRLRGIIDRIDRHPDGTIEIIDYKTGGPKSQAKVDADDQLTMYALAMREGAVRDPVTACGSRHPAGSRSTSPRPTRRLHDPLARAARRPPRRAPRDSPPPPQRRLHRESGAVEVPRLRLPPHLPEPVRRRQRMSHSKGVVDRP